MGSDGQGTAGQKPEYNGRAGEGWLGGTHLPLRGLRIDHTHGGGYREGAARGGGDRMSQNSEKPKSAKIKLEAKPDPSTIIIVNQPMVRDFSTGGGHLPGDTLIEGDATIVTRH